MKKGDKIVCINCEKFTTFNGTHKRSVKKIKNNKIYTVLDGGYSYDVLLKEIPGTFYLTERFVSLHKHRLMKLEQLKNNIGKNGRKI